MAKDNISPKTGPLFDEFSASSYDEWYDATIKSLKGRKPFDKLIAQTYEGITLQPIYRREDAADLPHLDSAPGQFPYVRGAKATGYLEAPWLIAQELNYATPAEFNAALQDDLARGQTAVNLIPDIPTRLGLDPDQSEAGEVGGVGLSLAAIADLATALEGVDLAETPIFIRGGSAGLPLAALLFAYVKQSDIDPAVLGGGVEVDPLGELARRGEIPLSLEDAYDEMAALVKWTAAHTPEFQAITVHGYPYANSGGSAVDELAFALATGVAYLRALEERGVDVNDAASQIGFAFSLGGDFFMEIAKLRAARLLWAKIVTAFGGSEEAAKMTLHGRTARRNKTLTDAYVNMIRVTTEAFSGAAAGVDSLHVAPFDEEVGPPDDFSRRIARNVQIILQEEANLAQVMDPAGGAWFVESLTDQVAERAWSLFQEVEKRGGMAAALGEEFPQRQVAETAARRAGRLAQRKDVLVGTNRYVNLEEERPSSPEIDYEDIYRERVTAVQKYREESDWSPAAEQSLSTLSDLIAAAEAGATLGQLTTALRPTGPGAGYFTAQPVHWHRLAEPFEALRANADAYEEEHGRRPRIFLATMGPLRQHKGRADFAHGFFQVGGFEILYPDGFDTPGAAAEAALAAEADAVVICSTDDTYPEIVAGVVETVRGERTFIPIILAGYPKEQVEAHRQAGVDEFIYLGADCLAINRWLQKKLM